MKFLDSTGVTTLVTKLKNKFAKVATSGSYNDLSNKPTIPTVPTNVSAFTNDAGYLTSYTENDPTVPSWAKAANKPTYTASEVGALPSTTVIPTASTTNPLMDGTASYGSGTAYARSNHVHPTDTSKLSLTGGTMTGDITISTPSVGDSFSIGDTGKSIQFVKAFANNGEAIDVYANGVSFFADSVYVDGALSMQTNWSPTNTNHVTTKQYVDNGLSSKQATLVSGTNIKTINGTSILGSGNLAVSGLPSVTASDNGKVLTVVNGAWAAASLPTYAGEVIQSASGVNF